MKSSSKGNFSLLKSQPEFLKVNRNVVRGSATGNLSKIPNQVTGSRSHGHSHGRTNHEYPTSDQITLPNALNHRDFKLPTTTESPLVHAKGKKKRKKRNHQLDNLHETGKVSILKICRKISQLEINPASGNLNVDNPAIQSFLSQTPLMKNVALGRAKAVAVDVKRFQIHNRKNHVTSRRSSMLFHMGRDAAMHPDHLATDPEESDSQIPHIDDPVKCQVDNSVLKIAPEQNGESREKPITFEDFEQLKYLGRGAFGTVTLVRHRQNGRLFAQKQLRKAKLRYKNCTSHAITERSILESVHKHPFLVQLYYAFQDDERLYLVMEYASGGELFHYLKRDRMLPESTVSFYTAEMVLALSYLHHELDVVYRDLKPENCLLDHEGHLLLTDFGLCKRGIQGSNFCTTFTGTISYMAPEIILGKEYGQSVDWWSLGAIAYDLLTGSCPFRANCDSALREKITKAKLTLPNYISPDAKDIFTRLLRKEPRKRLGTNMPKDLETIKRHRFFRKINWVKLALRESTAPIHPEISNPELAESFDEEFTSIRISQIDHHQRRKSSLELDSSCRISKILARASRNASSINQELFMHFDAVHIQPDEFEAFHDFNFEKSFLCPTKV